MRRRPTRSVLCLGLAACAGACASGGAPLPAPQHHPEPEPGAVQRVLFLLGDPGEATTRTSPLLQRLQRDVEHWSAALGRDSAVAVLVLGDIRYPAGLRPRGTEEFVRDTAVIMSQVRVVQGPHAVANEAWMYLIPGNHDWGQREDFAGFVRLDRLDRFLALARERTGAAVRLAPEAGSGGPDVVEGASGPRLLLLDTAWWLLTADDGEKAAFLERVERAMVAAGDRDVILAAHHPFRSVGAHGGTYSFWEMLGVGYVVRRSGALLQSLNSRPYRELERGLRNIFARAGPPAAFVGGHDHSLQVLEALEPTDPRYSIVSGSGSKLTDVRAAAGVTFARSAPGYMRLLVEEDGGLHLSVISASERFLMCGGGEPARATCMAEGMEAFETVHSQPLR